MILLEEAIERYRLAVRDFGIGVERHRRATQAARSVVQVERRIGDLRLPAELRHLWLNYTSPSFGSLYFDGVYRPEDALRVYERDVSLGYPRVVMPLAFIERAGIWIELETPEHPRGRIYHTFYDDAELQLWCVDLSMLTHLVAETIEQGGVNEPTTERPWIDVGVFDHLRLERTSEMLAMPDEWRIPVTNRSSWPSHWRGAEGLAPAMAPKPGPTHTIASFNDERASARVTGTIVARITGLVSGGPIDGLVLSLSDDSGSLQFYASADVERSVSQIGFGAQAEFDVIGEPHSPGGQPARSSSLRRSFEDLRSDIFVSWPRCGSWTSHRR